MFLFRKQLKIGTRGSKLALWQANFIKKKLADIGFDSDIVTIKTKGDIIKKPLYEFGGKGLFIKEIETALLNKQIDIAVHSLKDMSVYDSYDFEFITLKRDDYRDVFVSYQGGLFEIKKGARIGTTSLRRRTQLYAIRDDFLFENLRGNLDTRLKKLKDGEVDAIVVSKSGLIRLGLYDKDYMYDIDSIIPSAGQGVIAIEFLKGFEYKEKLRSLEDKTTRVCVDAERTFVKQLNASCSYPIGAHTYFVEKKCCMDVMYGYLDDIAKYEKLSFCSDSVIYTLSYCIDEMQKRIER